MFEADPWPTAVWFPNSVAAWSSRFWCCSGCSWCLCLECLYLPPDPIVSHLDSGEPLPLYSASSDLDCSVPGLHVQFSGWTLHARGGARFVNESGAHLQSFKIE